MGEPHSPHRRVRRVIVGHDSQQPHTPPPKPRSSEPAPGAHSAAPPPTAPSEPAAPSEQHVARVRSELQEKTGKLRARVEQMEQLIAARSTEQREQARQHKAEVEQQAREAQQQGKKRTEQAFTARLADLHNELTGSVQTLAPGALAAPLAKIGTAKTDALTGYVTIGSMQVGAQQSPALVPFFCREHWLLEGSTRLSHELLLNSLVRLLPAVAVKHLRILVFDPRITGALSALSSLRSVNAATFPRAYADADQFNEALREALVQTTDNVERMGVQGHRNLLDFWAASEVPEGIATIAIVLDHPYGINDELAATIRRVLDSDPGNGLTLVIETDPAMGALTDPAWQDIAQRCEHLRVENGGWNTAQLAQTGAVIHHDGVVAPEVIASVIEQVRTAAASVTGPTYPLAELIGSSIAQPWTKDATDSLDAVIGRAGRDVLRLSLRSENPPTPNLLIGGAVGQGKSNLLLDIIFSLAVDYSPAELELHLLDFKRGLEFKRFDQDENGEGWLPHVRSLSLESNQEFGIAVLRHVEREYQRRSELFKQAGATSIGSYRRLTGQVLPRLLLIIDEFHVLFDGDNDVVDEAVELLDSLARLGRAYGIHLLLASQTTSGISGLRTKGESIFAQFPLRMSLKNTAQESEAILSQHNRAAAELTYRGEVIVNENFGLDPEGSNVRGVAAWAESDTFARIQRELWQREHGEPPLVFIGSEYASWSVLRHRELCVQPDGVGEFWVGRPIELSERPIAIEVDSDTDQAIAIVGNGDDVAGAVLTAGISTLLKTLPAPTPLTFLNASRQLPAALGELIDTLRAAGREVEVIERREIPEYLVNTLAAELEADDETPHVIVGLAMQRIARMDTTVEKADTDEFNFDFDAPSLATGNDVMRALMKDGALNQKYFIGWWSSLQGLTNTTGFGHPGVGTYITLRIGVDDLREIAGPTAQPIIGSPRAGVFQRASDDGLITAVPFAPLPEEMWSTP